MAVAVDQEIKIEDRYKMFLKLFSVLFSLNLTEQEITILNDFLWNEDGEINEESRKRVAARLNITGFNLTNYLGKLRKRNVIIDNALHEGIKINVMPASKVLSIVFNLKTKDGLQDKNHE